MEEFMAENVVAQFKEVVKCGWVPDMYFQRRVQFAGGQIRYGDKRKTRVTVDSESLGISKNNHYVFLNTYYMSGVSFLLVSETLKGVLIPTIQMEKKGLQKSSSLLRSHRWGMLNGNQTRLQSSFSHLNLPMAIKQFQSPLPSKIMCVSTLNPLCDYFLKPVYSLHAHLQLLSHRSTITLIRSLS